MIRATPSLIQMTSVAGEPVEMQVRRVDDLNLAEVISVMVGGAVEKQVIGDIMQFISYINHFSSN